ncbi:MAG: formylglycine-generating enzyme family protein [Verrucomicrobia bacterium]|nr:formylglycine-generating enzyme family protein [Verrucomicrobiota bacterium]
MCTYSYRVVMSVWGCAVSLLVWAILAPAQVVVPSSYQNGQLSWENTTGHSYYRVEWSPSPNGPWRRTLQYVDLVESGYTSEPGTAIPLHYRVVRTTNEPIHMTFIEGGPFDMGDPSGLLWNLPVHTINVSSFYIQRIEVSWWLWNEVWYWGLSHGYPDLPAGEVIGTSLVRSNHPVVEVSWHDAVKWCNARSEKENLEPVYYKWSIFIDENVYRTGTYDIQTDYVRWDANGYRLPTEAEWEKAARGGLTRHYYPWRSFGGDYSVHIDGSKANYFNSYDPFTYTTPCGYYKGGQEIGGLEPEGIDMANGFGLYDMAGNVSEHVWDRYDPTHNYYTTGPTNDPRGIGYGELRLNKGGSWDDHYSLLMCGDHHFANPTNRQTTVGFRCVRAAD